jgi:hypothetical protein
MPNTPLRGSDALAMLPKLRRVWSDASGREGPFLDEATGAVWRLDFPDSEQHGGRVALGLPGCMAQKDENVFAGTVRAESPVVQAVAAAPPDQMEWLAA